MLVDVIERLLQDPQQLVFDRDRELGTRISDVEVDRQTRAIGESFDELLQEPDAIVLFDAVRDELAQALLEKLA